MEPKKKKEKHVDRDANNGRTKKLKNNVVNHQNRAKRKTFYNSRLRWQQKCSFLVFSSCVVRCDVSLIKSKTHKQTKNTMKTIFSFSFSYLSCIYIHFMIIHFSVFVSNFFWIKWKYSCLQFPWTKKKRFPF